MNKYLLVFHNLNIEGAPTMLVKTAKILVDSEKVVEAISLSDGVYKNELDKLGVPVKVIKTTNLLSNEFDEYIKSI